VIKTKQYDVEVLGTVFNILAYPDDKHVMTTLIEGSVRVTDFDDSGNEVFLKPQEQLILDKTEKGIFIRKVDAGNYTAWKNGRFVFISQNLEDILKTLSRWYNFDVEFESDELKKIVFTGNIDKYEELSTLLEMIAKTNKVNFKIEDKKVLATTRK
jgi:ferric-dicitrate binding protein FerR (iron transport regulator)